MHLGRDGSARPPACATSVIAIDGKVSPSFGCFSFDFFFFLVEICCLVTLMKLRKSLLMVRRRALALTAKYRVQNIVSEGFFFLVSWLFSPSVSNQIELTSCQE